MAKKVRTWILPLACLCLCACGYHFRGGGTLPAGVQTVYIQQFENRTSEIGLETLYTSALTNEFILNREGVIVPRERADAILIGVIRSIRTQNISRTAQLRSVERRVIITMDITLVNQQGERIWIARGISDNQQFSTSNDQTVVNRNKREAIVDLAQKMAEKILNRLTEDF